MKENDVIRVLHFVPNLLSGGTETFIMNMYRNVNRNKIQFDFVVHTNQKGFFEDEIVSLGGKIYRFPVKDNLRIFHYIKELNKFFKIHPEYQIVHGAMPSLGFIYLAVAKYNRVKVRIAHSHSAFHERNFKGYLKHFVSRFMKYSSNLNLACSDLAGKYLFGNDDFKIVHNAIDISKYHFSKNVRETIRKNLNIPSDKVVLGHVGRLSVEKNHHFLIDIMSQLDLDKYIMVFVGGGALEDNLKNYVKEKKLENNVLFLGVCKNVPEIMQSFDMFLLPSLFEGLPTVAIEAQSSGLPCLISSTVTNEVVFSEKTKLIPLKQSEWISAIEDTEINSNRNVISSELEDLYDIHSEAKRLCEIYETSLKK